MRERTARSCWARAAAPIARATPPAACAAPTIARWSAMRRRAASSSAAPARRWPCPATPRAPCDLGGPRRPRGGFGLAPRARSRGGVGLARGVDRLGQDARALDGRVESHRVLGRDEVDPPLRLALQRERRLPAIRAPARALRPPARAH